MKNLRTVPLIQYSTDLCINTLYMKEYVSPVYLQLYVKLCLSHPLMQQKIVFSNFKISHLRFSKTIISIIAPFTPGMNMYLDGHSVFFFAVTLGHHWNSVLLLYIKAYSSCFSKWRELQTLQSHLLRLQTLSTQTIDFFNIQV